MPSEALRVWRTDASRALDEMASAHAAVGGTGPGRRRATEQINHAYAVLLSSWFQRFCRELHTEAADRLSAEVANTAIEVMAGLALVRDRKLDRGNPNPGNLGADFGRFGLAFWDAVSAHDARNADRKRRLEELNRWRNAIAHQDFDPAALGVMPLHLSRVRAWRSACDRMAESFDAVVFDHLRGILGVDPW